MTGRNSPPQAGPIRPYEFPPVLDDSLDNGMKLRIVHNLPGRLVTAMVVLRAGETGVPRGQGGLAVLTGDALEGGTARLSSRELAARLEDIGASFGATTGWDYTTVSVSCLAEHLGRAMPLLAGMVRSPAFAPSEFQRYRAQRLATATHRRMDPGSLAADSFVRFVFGEEGTYGRPLGGTEASLGALGPACARDFAMSRYGPGQAALVVAGDVESREALELADQSFGDWDREVETPPEAVDGDGERGRSVHVVHRGGSVQSEIRVGHVGVSRFIDDFFPLTTLNLVLGGSFGSRLNLNLRERHGFTYGVRSSFATRRGAGPFTVSTSVESAVTGAAVREIFSEIVTLVEQGPAEEEIAAATSYLAGVFPLRMETTGQIASRVAATVVFDLPADYYHGYRDRVRAVTRDKAAEAAQRHIRPDELCAVVVGEAGEVAPALEALGIGPVTVHTDEGGPG